MPLLASMDVPIRCKKLALLLFDSMKGIGSWIWSTFLKKALSATLTCVVAFGGFVMGTVVGAMKGQTTETGCLRGAGIGAVTGAITAIQLLESVADGEPILSKVALLSSLVNGKVFPEWVVPAVLKAYQWQIGAFETSYRDISDIYDTNGFRGLKPHYIQKIPSYSFKSSQFLQQCQELGCSICLEELNDGDLMNRLPSCDHCFHLHCLDPWLVRNGSCPICRCDVSTGDHTDLMQLVASS